MNIRYLTLLIAIIIPCCISGQVKEKKFKFNYGAKAGFQAIAYNSPQFGIDGYEFDGNTLHSNNIGYTISPFARLTFQRFYVQVEGTFGLTRHSFDFKSAEESKITPNDVAYNLRTLCMQLPVLIGYNIVDEDKYLMSLFTGPKTKFIFTAHTQQDFKHFRQPDLEEVLNKRCYYWEFGLGVKIGVIFFDFVYDLGMTKASKYIISKSDGKKFKSNRRDSILSFSVGMMF